MRILIEDGIEAGQGLGLEIAKDLVENTDFVVYAGCSKQEDEKRVLDIGKERLVPVMVDVTSDTSVKNAATVIKGDLKEKKLEIVGLVNNAAIATGMQALEYTTTEELRSVFENNFVSSYTVFQAFAEDLRKSHGRVLNFSSIFGFIAPGFWGAYSASKSAIEAFSDALRQEMLPFEVSVSIIQLGLVESDDDVQVFKAAETLAKDDPYLKAKKAMQRMYSFVGTDFWNSDIASKAVLDAFTSKFPKTRYRVGGFGKISSEVLSWISWAAHDRVFDF